MPKRAAETASAPAAKAARQDPNIKGVRDGLQRALAIGVLDKKCAEMFELGLVGAFGLPPAERHHSQNKVVGILQDILAKVKDHVQGVLDEATSKVTELDSSKNDLDGKVEAAAEVVKKASEEADEAVTGLLAAGKQVKEAEAELKKKTKAKSDAEKALAKATKAQETFATGVDAHLKPLQDGEFGEGGAAPHKKAILPLLEGAGVEESLFLAFPSSCDKPVSGRTSFDTMVFEAVSKAVAAKKEANDTLVSEQTAAVAQAESDVKAAEEAVASSMEKKKAAEETMEQASAKKLKAEEAAAEAQATKDNFEPSYAKAAAAKEEAAMDLENFTVYNMGCFEVLCNDIQPEAKATPATEEAATA